MKKIVLLIFIACGISTIRGQSVYEGIFVRHDRNTIQVFSDSTFKHVSVSPNHFPYWSRGKWKASNDTLYFEYVPIYDTLIYYDTLRFANSPKRVKTYSIVLSTDEKSATGTKNAINRDNIFLGLQSCEFLPVKLYFKKNVLYDIDSQGNIIKKKYKYGRKKYFSGYFKEEKQHP